MRGPVYWTILWKSLHCVTPCWAPKFCLRATRTPCSPVASARARTCGPLPRSHTHFIQQVFFKLSWARLAAWTNWIFCWSQELGEQSWPDPAARGFKWQKPAKNKLKNSWNWPVIRMVATFWHILKLKHLQWPETEIKWICWSLIWKIREITADIFFGGF